jgi:hypothetical protein
MIKVKLLNINTNIISFGDSVENTSTNMFLSAVPSDGGTLTVTLAYPYSWHSAVNDRRVVNWSGTMLKVSYSEGTQFKLNVYSIPSLESTITDIAVSMQIISETEAQFYHTIPASPSQPSYVPPNSIFKATTTPNFGIIFLFTFFN